jgi:hypothetical protein
MLKMIHDEDSTVVKHYVEELEKLQISYNSMMKVRALGAKSPQERNKGEINRLKTVIRSKDNEIKRSESIISQLR